MSRSAESVEGPTRQLSPGVKPLLVLSKIRGILDAFTLRSPLLTLGELRAATGYPTSTVQRLVANMVAEGFLDREGDRYTTGVNFAYWAAAAAGRLDVVEAAAPILQRLRDETGETASLLRVERSFGVCIAMAETHHALRREMRVGKLLPLHAGAGGKVLLAWNDHLASEVLTSSLERFTQATVTDPDTVREQLAEVRRRGYAISREEQDEGAAGVAVPVRGIGETVNAALAVSAPAFRASEELQLSWVDSMVRAADELSRLAGGRV
jgi:DNA-binding IclR family transcriptional regulator